MKQIKNYHELFNSNIPFNIKNDCQKRIYDWVKSGGHFRDVYVQRQYEFASRFL